MNNQQSEETSSCEAQVAKMSLKPIDNHSRHLLGNTHGGTTTRVNNCSHVVTEGEEERPTQQPTTTMTSTTTAFSTISSATTSSSAIANNFSKEASSKARKSHRSKREKQRQIQEAAAETAALYYGECYMRGVGGSTADQAAHDSHSQYKKWWLQEFSNHGDSSRTGSSVVASVGDAHLLPKFNDVNVSNDDDRLGRRNNNRKSSNFKPQNDSLHQKETIQAAKPNDLVDSSTEVIGTTFNQNVHINENINTYHSVADYEYYGSNPLGFHIGGTANAAATATVERDFDQRQQQLDDNTAFNTNDNIISSSQSSTPHTSNCQENQKQKHSDSPIFSIQLQPQQTKELQQLPQSRNLLLHNQKNDANANIDDLSNNLKKKRRRQHHSHNNNHNKGLSDFFSLERPSNGKEKEEDVYEHVSTATTTNIASIPKRSSSSFFHDMSARARSMSNNLENVNIENANLENAMWVPTNVSNAAVATDDNNNDKCRNQESNDDQEQMESNDIQIPSSNDKYNAILTSRGTVSQRRAKHIDNAKLALLHSLAMTGGDVTSQQFLFALEQLRTLYKSTEYDARLNNYYKGKQHKTIDGMWFNLSRPNFDECIGKNASGDYMYSLGRMSFDMFTPGHLVCSIQGIFNNITTLNINHDESRLKSVPKSLKNEIKSGNSIIRTYDIVTAFTVESNSPQFGDSSPNRQVHKALRGIMTTHGYVLPDPKIPNRFSIWFSGGKIEPNDDDKELDRWSQVFGGDALKRHLYEKARILAAKLLLGAEVPTILEDDGSMSFTLHRPIGGHGTTYVDVLYLDETLRVVQGNRGSLFVFTRIN